MISKCQNIVINRTKFSEFEEFDTATNSIEGLRLVGYIETTDVLGNKILKNVSVGYPEVSAIDATGKLIGSVGGNGDGAGVLYEIGQPCADKTFIKFLTIPSDFIQINEIANDLFSDGYFNISFAEDFPLGKEVKLFFNGSLKGNGIRKVAMSVDGTMYGFTLDSNIIIEQGDMPSDSKILLTFVVTASNYGTNELTIKNIEVL